MKITGTFTYDLDNKTITFKRDDGEPVRSILIDLPGADAFSVGGGRVRRQYRQIELCFARNRQGTPDMAFAIPAPCDWRFRPGMWVARLLAMPAPLAEWLFGEKALRQPYQNGDVVDFWLEFSVYWQWLRQRAYQGWMVVGALSLAFGAGYLLA